MPTSNSNPLSTPEPWNDVADGYAEQMRPILEAYANDAIELFDGCQGSVVLDVACGPGTLSCLLQDRAKRVDAIDFSPEMIRTLVRAIEKKGANNIFPQLMDGQNLSFPDKSFDFAFSMFGLMLFPDRGKGIAEICRVLKPGGRCAISSWTPIDRSPLMAAILDTAIAIIGQPPTENTQAAGIDDPELFRTELQDAGFADATIHIFRHSTRVEDVQSFWHFMERSAAPIAMLQRAFSKEEWQGKTLIAIEHLEKNFPKMPADLGTEAYIGVGTRID